MCSSLQAEKLDHGRYGYCRGSAEIENGAAGDQRGSNQDQTMHKQTPARVQRGVQGCPQTQIYIHGERLVMSRPRPLR